MRSATNEISVRGILVKSEKGILQEPACENGAEYARVSKCVGDVLRNV